MIQDLIAAGGVRSVYQPIVDLDTDRVVGYEALARGPEGSELERPDRLFAAARASGMMEALDEACAAAAIHGAVAQGLASPLALFVNVEPEAVHDARLAALVDIAEAAPRPLRLVFEVTERALAERPAELLATVAGIRAQGWAVALDDVGADPASLAFMPLLRPEIVKLDLRLVQRRPSRVVAQIMNAVNAYAEESGAVILAEGIETDEQLATARALGARLGQGWLFGRPGAIGGDRAVGTFALSSPGAMTTRETSPFACLDPGTALRRSTKTLLIEISKHLEEHAMRQGDACVVAATFQHAKHFTPLTQLRYRNLSDTVGFVCALGEGLAVEPLPGVRGADLRLDDPIRGEWDIVVLSPHFAAALLARDLGDTGPDRERRFDFALTYRRDVVVKAAWSLLSRVAQARAAARPVDISPASGDASIIRRLAA